MVQINPKGINFNNAGIVMRNMCVADKIKKKGKIKVIYNSTLQIIALTSASFLEKKSLLSIPLPPVYPRRQPAGMMFILP